MTNILSVLGLNCFQQARPGRPPHYLINFSAAIFFTRGCDFCNLEHLPSHLESLFYL